MNTSEGFIKWPSANKNKPYAGQHCLCSSDRTPCGSWKAKLKDSLRVDIIAHFMLDKIKRSCCSFQLPVWDFCCGFKPFTPVIRTTLVQFSSGHACSNLWETVEIRGLEGTAPCVFSESRSLADLGMAQGLHLKGDTDEIFVDIIKHLSLTSIHFIYWLLTSI